MLCQSFGGGRQSWSIICLILQDKLPKPDLIVFSNVGGEDPDTLLYLKKYRHLIENACTKFQIVQPGDFKAGVQKSLYRDLMDTGKLRIPAILARTNGARANRTCTNEWKVRMVRRAMRSHYKGNWTQWLGYSFDEIERMKSADRQWLTHAYPLIDLGLRVRDCLDIVKSFGLSDPPNSRCFFCPFKTPLDWEFDRQKRPAIYNASLALQDRLNEERPGDPIILVNHDERMNTLPMCGSDCWT